MFGTCVRRSGSKRCNWHNRERKRRPGHFGAAEPGPVSTVRWRPQPTEAEWLAGDPQTMMRCVVRLATDRGIVFHMTPGAVARKLRLFCCACARHRWALLPDVARRSLDVVERYANGQEATRALRAARRQAQAARQAAYPVWAPGGWPANAWDVSTAIGVVETAAAVHVRLREWSGAYVGIPPDGAEQTALLRDLFDNPFRPTDLDPRWYTSDVVRLARCIRADRAFDLMPVLGDALQDAGCASGAVLDHCYGGCRRVPGCWLVDSLAG